ncbi:MAG: hypothetical protein E7416_00845 [Ruminococcaceae bacterium]|nr:hypothetical protein [Oscillospiraceae bacterium]
MTKRSKCLFVATALATCYAIYLISYFFGTTASSEGAEAVGGAIATALVMPHMIMFLIGAVFGWIGVFAKKTWAALVGAILYSVGTLMFMMYFMFGVPILVLGFIGYSKQKKLNNESTSEKD